MANFTLKLILDEKLSANAYQHVHHADSIRLLEQGRLAYLENLGFSQEKFYTNGHFLVIASIQVRYKREIKCSEVQVTCENGRVLGRSIWLSQSILNALGKVLVTAEIEFMILDKKLGRAISVPQDFATAISASTET